jgi:hypothetical protein
MTEISNSSNNDLTRHRPTGVTNIFTAVRCCYSLAFTYLLTKSYRKTTAR